MTSLLMAIIFLEGYAALSAELLAMRLMVPYVDSAADTVSIIVAAVLLPLAFGYYAGGKFSGDARQKLLMNLVIAAPVLCLGLSHEIVDGLFAIFYKTGITNRIVQTSIYSLLFIAGPVYLLGQTVPLAAALLPQQKLARLTGTILFISTLGSFMGAVFCTLVLMAMIGVYLSAVVTIFTLAVLILLLNGKRISWYSAVAVIVFAAAMALNGVSLISVQQKLIPAQTAYNETIPLPPAPERPRYVEFIENNFITPATEKSILVIGKNPLIAKDNTDNKIERTEQILANNTKYDLIIIDASYGYESIPGKLITREFFETVKNALKDDGIVIAFLPASPVFANQLSADIDATFRSVFKNSNRERPGGYDGWTKNPGDYSGILYTYFHQPVPDTVYTDNKNRSYYDRYRIVD